MKWFTITCLCIMFLAGLSVSAYALEGETHLINSNDYADNAVTLSFDKFGRGVVNTLFGFVEIPKQSIKRAIDTNHSYGYASGMFIGIGYFIIRELAGVYEIISFPIPAPANYTPVMDPLMGYKPKIELKH